MPCQQCGGDTKKPTAKFCSVACKSEFQRGKGRKLDPTKRIRCKIDGYECDDYLNLSGALRRHSEKTLGKPFDWADWEIFEVEFNPAWRCPYCDWTTKDTLGGWVRLHLLNTHNKLPEDHCGLYPEDRKLFQKYWKEYEMEKFKNESEDNRVVCLECGGYFRRITETHLKNAHGMTVRQYREKYPMAETLSVASSKIASEIYFSDIGLSKSNYVSEGEREVGEFIRSIGFDAKKYRSGMYEIDIFIEEKRLGFEYNGLFHHSEFRSGRGEKYHVGKTDLAEKDGIRLIQIFDDEWNTKREIVKSRIRSILGVDSNFVYARNTVVRPVELDTLKPFLDNNHLQGYTHATHSYGLYVDDELIQCMTFSPIRSRVGGESKDGSFELVRMCTKIGYSVVGGAEKLLKHFEADVLPKTIITYADRRWSSRVGGNVYERIGFSFHGITDPCFWGTKNYVRREKHRSYFTKENMRTKHPDVFYGIDIDDIKQSEMMNMLGYDRVWDCGNLKYVKVLTHVENIPETETDEKFETEFNYSGSRQRRGSVKQTKETDVKCGECGLYYPIHGIAVHIRMTHHLTVDEYVLKYSEYRPKQLKLLRK